MGNSEQLITVNERPVNLSEVLAADGYVRERTQPRIGDPVYLCLLDLREFVARSAPRLKGAVVDYGCGGSPYRELFKHCSRYTRADMSGEANIDILLDASGKIDEPPGSYEGVVSFQVLEHVKGPGEYLDECFRLLADDGLLLLTTHGMFLEHKCPNDYYRWTSQGLEALVSAHGFTVIESVKLTTGMRGAFQLSHFVVEDFIHRRGTFGGLLARIFRRVYRVTLMPALNFIGKQFLRREGMISGDKHANVYIGVGVLARKSQSSLARGRAG